MYHEKHSHVASEIFSPSGDWLPMVTNPYLKAQVILHPKHLHTVPNVSSQSKDTKDLTTLQTITEIFSPTPLLHVVLHVRMSGTGQTRLTTENSKPHQQYLIGNHYLPLASGCCPRPPHLPINDRWETDRKQWFHNHFHVNRPPFP